MCKGKKVKENISDALLELVLAGVCFGIGALVLLLFGADVWQADPELAILIGAIVVIVLIVVGYFVVNKIKKSRTKVRDSEDSTRE